MSLEGIAGLNFADARGQSLIVALSGGADSVALLRLLLERRDVDGLGPIFAAHYHHGIRGADADGDAAFCRALCADLNVPFFEGRGDVPALARMRGIGLESAAREARYAFLESARAQCGADCIALAQHMDDQAETVLMHLFRGAGPDGLCGMARASGRLYRPLLEVSRAQLRQYLAARGQEWREDASNARADNPRNALRLNVLPEIEKSYPSAAAAIARYARAAQIERDYIAEQSARFLSERLERGPYGRRLRLHGGEAQALLRRALRALCGDLSAKKLEALCALCAQGRGRLEISGKLRAERTRDYLYVQPARRVPPEPAKLRLPGDAALEGVCRLRAEPGRFPIEPDNPLRECVDADAIEGAALRTRRDGDRFHPLGAPGDRLLSDYLTDRKVERPLRDTLPLVAVGGRVLWVCGVGLSETARVRADSRACARLSIHYMSEKELEVEQ